MDELLRAGVFDVAEHTRDFVDGDDSVGGAVVLGERAVGEGVVVEALQAGLSVFGELRDIEKLAGDVCYVGAHQGDVSVARPDIAAFNRIGCVDDRFLHFLLQVVGEPVHVVDGDLEQLSAAEIGPVPIRW